MLLASQIGQDGFASYSYIYVTRVSYTMYVEVSQKWNLQFAESRSEQRRSVFVAKVVLVKSICVLSKFFISARVIVLRRRFSVVRTGSSLSLKKNCYLLLQRICFPQNVSMFTFVRAQDNGMLRLGWLCFELQLLPHLLLFCMVIISLVLVNVAVTCLVERSIITKESYETASVTIRYHVALLLILSFIFRS